MDEKVAERLRRLKAVRINGEPVVLEHENPVHKLGDAIVMAERAGLLYRYAMDGRDFEYRVAESDPVRRCKMTEGMDILCNLVLGKYEVREWEPTPEYAKLLEEKPKPNKKAKPKPEPEAEPEQDPEPIPDPPE